MSAFEVKNNLASKYHTKEELILRKSLNNSDAIFDIVTIHSLNENYHIYNDLVAMNNISMLEITEELPEELYRLIEHFTTFKDESDNSQISDALEAS